MSTETPKPFDPAAAARFLVKEVRDSKQANAAGQAMLFREISELRALVSELANQLAQMAAKPAAPPPSAAVEGPRRYQGRIMEDARQMTSKNGKLLVILKLRADGKVVDFMCAGRAAERCANLGEGSQVEIEAGEIESRPATDKSTGAPILAKKGANAGQQIINYSAFAEHVKVIEAEAITKAAPRDEYADFGKHQTRQDYSDFGAPARPGQPAAPTPKDPLGFDAEDQIPF